MKVRHLIISIVLVASIFGCAKVPITGRKQLNMLPASIVQTLAIQNYQAFLTANPPVTGASKSSVMVKSVGAKLTMASQVVLREVNQMKRVKGFQWEFNLVESPDVNAWCMPGGKVVVYSGILPITQDEAGLATVMGHEIAHAIGKHGNERLSQQLAIQLAGMSLQVAMREKPEQTRALANQAFGIGSQLGQLAYSRKHEYESDKMGMVFMAKAGYNPALAIDFWKRMAEKSQKPPVPEFLSTHPSDANRVAALQEFLPTAMKYYTPKTNS